MEGEALSSSWRKAIATLEIVGGAVGSCLVVFRLGSQPTPVAVAIGAAFFTTCLVAIIAGLLLWRNTRLGRVLSVAVQVIQLPKVWSVPFTFAVGFGLDIAPTAISRPDGFRGVVFDMRLFPHAVLALDTPGMPVGFGVSAVSCVSLWFLLGLGRLPRQSAPEPRSEVGSDGAVAAFRQSCMGIELAKRDA